MCRKTEMDEMKTSNWDEEGHYGGFACRCGEEGEAEMRMLREWADKHIADEKHPFQDEWFTTRLIHEMTYRYHADITGIPMDMWGALQIDIGESDRIATKGGSMFVQFDRFEDGLLLALYALYARYGPKRLFNDEKEEA